MKLSSASPILKHGAPSLRMGPFIATNYTNYCGDRLDRYTVYTHHPLPETPPKEKKTKQKTKASNAQIDNTTQAASWFQ